MNAFENERNSSSYWKLNHHSSAVQPVARSQHQLRTRTVGVRLHTYGIMKHEVAAMNLLNLMLRHVTVYGLLPLSDTLAMTKK
jgi:hypothetical protein